MNFWSLLLWMLAFLFMSTALPRVARGQSRTSRMRGLYDIQSSFNDAKAGVAQELGSWSCHKNINKV